MDIRQARKVKKVCESEILKIIKEFQNTTDLKVRKIHLNVNIEPSTKNEFVNIILKGL